LKIPKEQSEATEEQTNMAKRRRTDKHGQKKNRQTWPKEEEQTNMAKRRTDKHGQKKKDKATNNGQQN
jgi:hypothetical protein